MSKWPPSFADTQFHYLNKEIENPKIRGREKEENVGRRRKRKIKNLRDQKWREKKRERECLRERKGKTKKKDMLEEEENRECALERMKIN